LVEIRSTFALWVLTALKCTKNSDSYK
jgi:hypothetical protein